MFENFREGVTVLMIAHRVESILQCDEILMLDSGNIVEHDNYELLKNNPISKFNIFLNER